MNTKDITFVVQGAIDRSISPLSGKPITQTCLEHLRLHHPGARIILSTWKEQAVEGLDFDEVVFSDDPGSLNCAPPGSGKNFPDNLNRQIVSSKNGLRLVQTKYAAKVRSDLIFLGNDWMSHFDAYPARSPEWKVFRERVITVSLFVRDPRCPFLSCPLHPSDWLHAGLTEDIQLLWDIDLQPEPESSRWFLEEPLAIPPDADGVSIDLDTRRFYPEQYIWRTLLMKFGELDFQDRGAEGPELTRITELSFANNLIVLDVDQFPLISHKHPLPLNPPVRAYRLLMHREWKWLYLKYCANRPAEAALSNLATRHFYIKRAYAASFAPLQKMREVRRRLVKA